MNAVAPTGRMTSHPTNEPTVGLPDPGTSIESPKLIGGERADRDTVLPDDAEELSMGEVVVAVAPEGQAPHPSQMSIDILDLMQWISSTPSRTGSVTVTLDSSGRSWIQATCKGWRSDVALSGPTGASQSVRLRPLQEITGRVVSMDGTPLAGAWVTLHAGSLASLAGRWNEGDRPLDRRALRKPRDLATAVTDSTGHFTLPNGPGILVAYHHDAWPVLAFPGIEPCELQLPSGGVLEGKVVDAHGDMPSAAPPLLVRIVPGVASEPAFTPFASQIVNVDAYMAFKASGLNYGYVIAQLENEDASVLDVRSVKVNAGGRAEITLCYDSLSPPARVRIHAAGSHQLLSRLELVRTVPVAEGESAITRVSLRRMVEEDQWEGVIPWRGSTVVQGASQIGGLLRLGNIEILNSDERFDINLPAGTILAQVIAAPGDFPMVVHLSPSTVDAEEEPLPFSEATLENTRSEAKLWPIPEGDWLVWADTTSGPLNGNQFVVIATSHVSVDANAVSSVVLRDETRVLDVFVICDGLPCPEITVAADSEEDPFSIGAIGTTDSTGVCKLRVPGPGPVSVWAYESGGASRSSGRCSGVAADRPVYLAIGDTSRVTFIIEDADIAAQEGLRLRVFSGPANAPTTPLLNVSEGQAAGVVLPNGVATVELVDSGGAVIQRYSVLVEKIEEQVLRLR